MNIQRIVALVKMELKKLIREPATLFLIVIFPAMLTLVFGLGFGEMESATPGVSQFDVMVPGLYAFVCIFIIMTVAQTFSEDREKGLLRRMNTTPLTSGEFMGSHILTNTLISVMQVIIVVVLSFLMGYRQSGGAGGLAIAFIFMIFLSVSSVGLGLITATIAKTPGAATGIAFIFIMPQMFLGTYIVPSTSTTAIISMFLPSAYVTDGIVMLFNGDLLNPLVWIKLVTVILISVVIVIAGILLFKKYGNK
jgi:ABC-2 type transport system permease protein